MPTLVIYGGSGKGWRVMVTETDPFNHLLIVSPGQEYDVMWQSQLIWPKKKYRMGPKNTDFSHF